MFFPHSILFLLSVIFLATLLVKKCDSVSVQFSLSVMSNCLRLSHPYMTTGKTIALTGWTFVGKVMSLLLNMLSRLVITFLPGSKRLLISWLQSPSAVILEPPKNKAEDIKKWWQEYIEELYKKDLQDPDNHNDVITNLEPDILQCEVKWALESITTNKASGGDGIPVELFQILKDDAVKVLHSKCQQIWKIQQWPQDWKRSVFIPIPKKGNAKECSTAQLHSSHTLVK